MQLKNLILFVLISTASFSFGQYDLEKVDTDSIKSPKSDKLITALKKNTYVGSGLNLLLGNQLYVYASPQIGYEFLPNFSAGFLSLFQYYQARSINQTYTQSAIGGGIFTRYIFLNRGIVESSFNLYKIKETLTGQQFPFETNAQSWMVGIGLSNPIGKKSFANFLISYDLLKDPLNPENTILDLVDFKLYYKFGIVIYPFNL